MTSPTTQSPTTTTMASEIADQPAAIGDTIAALLPVRAELVALANGRRHVLLVARGSSDNAAVYGRYLLEAHSGHRAALAAPSIATHYHSSLDLSDTVVVSVSQSGRTGEIVETQAWADAGGARTVAITNDAASPLADQADLALVTQAGTERAVPATKSYATQLVAMAILASALAPDPDVLAMALEPVPEQVQRLIDARVGITEVVERLAAARETMVSGRGLAYGTALETALKLEETCLRPVRGLSYADLRHGPIAVIDANVVAVLISAADGPMVDGMAELAADLRQRGAITVGVGGSAEFAETCHVAAAGPRLPEMVAPIGLIVPAQLIVEELARRLGLDPDEPRGLSKVTQTDPESTGGTPPDHDPGVT